MEVSVWLTLLQLCPWGNKQLGRKLGGHQNQSDALKDKENLLLCTGIPPFLYLPGRSLVAILTMLFGLSMGVCIVLN